MEAWEQNRSDFVKHVSVDPHNGGFVSKTVTLRPTNIAPVGGYAEDQMSLQC